MKLFVFFCCTSIVLNFFVASQCQSNTTPSFTSSDVNALGLLATTTQQSNWQKVKEGVKGIFTDFYMKHIVNKYQKLEDFFARTKEDLVQKASDTEKYLANISKRQKEILDDVKEDARDALRPAFDKINGWKDDVVSFENRIKKGVTTEYDRLTTEWKQSMTERWNGGLDNVIGAIKNAEIKNT